MSTEIAHSNSLADLAARITAEHAASRAAIRCTLEHALAAGDLLLEARAQIKHGQWSQWLKSKCGINDRTARLYMRLARHRAEIGNVTDLSVRGAAAMLASPVDSFASKAEPGQMTRADAERFTAVTAACWDATRDILEAAGINTEVVLTSILDSIHDEQPPDFTKLLPAPTGYPDDRAWAELGGRYKAACNHVTALAAAYLEEPLSSELGPALVAAFSDARDIAIELRGGRNGGAP